MEKGDKNHDGEDPRLIVARVWLMSLSSKNIFKPKVLAKVSRNDKCFLGTSIAVSQLLRPMC